MLTVTEIVSPTCAKISEVIPSRIFKSYTLSELIETEISSWICGGYLSVSVLKSVG